MTFYVSIFFIYAKFIFQEYLLQVCNFHSGKLIGPKWNWMAYSDKRWSGAVYYQKMFKPSPFNEVKEEELSDFDDIDEYGPSKFIASMPQWWNNGIPTLMLKHFLDPSVPQLVPICHEMKSNVVFPRFPQASDIKNVSSQELTN